VNEEAEWFILITSLIDQDPYKYEKFKKLHHLRWGVEELYKKKKSHRGSDD